MPATYEPIATTTLGSAASSITFSSIASSWTDLRVIFSDFSDTTATQYIRFNGDTGSNYSATLFAGYGTGIYNWQNSSASGIIVDLYVSGGSSTIPAFKTIDIFSYAGSTNKTILVTNSNDRNGSGAVERGVGLWRNTAAITSLTFYRGSGNFLTGTTATLYGIKNA